MPEGPSIVILKESVSEFTGRKIIQVNGNSKSGIDKLQNKKIISFRSWGKHFLICFPRFYVRIHLMLFGSYRINEEKENASPRLGIHLTNGYFNFYNCSIKIVDGDVDDDYDWRTDVMSSHWDSKLAMKKINETPDRMICDVLMDQSIFSGVGNIIKNEVLFRMRVHPESFVSAIPQLKLKAIVRDARKYCFLFYEWKKLFVLRKHWKIYRSKSCPRCHIKPLIKATGLGKRKSFICTNCQLLYHK